MIEKSLYYSVKKKICRMIYEDIYRDGDSIPPERKLSEELGVSRVTVRKALELLEEEHIIERIQGSGTRVALHYGARAGDMDIITLVAPAQNNFFSWFIDAFQTTAEEMNSLVLYKQKSRNMSLEQCLFQIYEKDLRNAVLWLEDMEISENELRKLRGLGMNIVLFDTSFQSEYADAICLDNQDAIEKLYEKLESEGCERFGYIGWDEHQVRSIKVREETFKKCAPDAPIWRIPYQYHNHLEELPTPMIERILEEMEECDAILYGVGELGMLFEREAKSHRRRHRAAMLDEFPGAEGYGIITLKQDFLKMSEQIFDCLRKQTEAGGTWRPHVYRVKGTVIER